jgi:hypothetical protein
MRRIFERGLASEASGSFGGRMNLSEAEAVARKMRDNAQLSELEMRSVVVDEDMGTVLGEALKRVKSLRVIELAVCSGPGLASLLDGVPEWITTLSVAHVELEEAALQAFAKALGRCRGLRSMAVAMEHLVAAVVEAMAAAPALKELEISQRSETWTPELVARLVDVVRRVVSVSSLKLDLATVPDELSEGLFAVVQANRGVVSLDFSAAYISFDRVTCWPRILDLNQLKHLRISRFASREITEEAALAFGRNRALISFHMDDMVDSSLLLDALEHNGMLIDVQVGVSGRELAIRLESLLERNRAMHERARRAALLLLTIRKYAKSELSRHPRDIVLVISKMVWSTRADFAWNDTSANAAMNETKSATQKPSKKPAKTSAEKPAKKLAK